MNDISEQISELSKLTKEHLLQHYKSGEKLYIEPSCYDFFADLERKRVKPAPAPKIDIKPVTITPVQTRVAPPPAPPKPKIPEPLTEIIEEVVQKEKVEVKVEAFKPESPQSIPKPSLNEIKSILSQLYPQMKIHENPPEDTLAKKEANRWLTTSNKVLILIYQEDANHHAFLEKVSKALIERKVSTSLLSVDIETIQQHLTPFPRLIIATPPAAKILPKNLHIPLLITEEIDRYLQDPAQKAILWKSMKEALDL